MSWACLDDGYYDNPKIHSCPLEAVAVHALSVSYCGKHLTDGWIPEYMVPVLTRGVTALVTVLLEKSLWDVSSDPSRPGYFVHNYLKYNRSKNQVKKDRESNAVRQARFRESRNAVSNAVHSPPLPSPPIPKEKPERDISKRKVFERPEPDEVKAFFTSKGINGNEYLKFYAFYDSKGWKVGSEPMVRWRSSAAGWILRNREGRE